MNKKTKVRIGECLEKALAPPKGKKFIPPVSTHTDPYLRRLDMTNQILEMYGDDDESADNNLENALTSITGKKEPKSKVNKCNLKVSPGQRLSPYAHPTEEIFNPNSFSNQKFLTYQLINDACYELTGRYITKEDLSVLKELVELLINEIRSAAKDAGPIENLPEFALKHFKEKLLK